MNIKQIAVVLIRIDALFFFYYAATALPIMPDRIHLTIERPLYYGVSLVMYFTRLVLHVAFGFVFLLRANEIAEWSTRFVNSCGDSPIYCAAFAIVRLTGLDSMYTGIVYATSVFPSLTNAIRDSLRPQLSGYVWPHLVPLVLLLLQIGTGTFMLVWTGVVARWLTKGMEMVVPTANTDSWPPSPRENAS
jgi:hypothetical protein